jgi:PAT family beta-lactamase induction signal transducer AmpG
MVVMGVLAALMALLGTWHFKTLPADQRAFAAPTTVSAGAREFLNTVVSWFQKPGIWLGMAFILLYRSGEGFIEKIGPLFMLDPVAKGGLALSNQALGHINGSFGTVGFMLGALLGGMFAAKMTLERSIVILALCMNVPHVCYFVLASSTAPSQSFVTAMVTIEKLGYGFGSVAHILYMMQQIAPGKYRTAHYAFATSLMGIGLMIPSMASGAIQEALGYKQFFLFCLVASIPSVIAAWLAPFHIKDEDAAPSTAPVGH